MKFADIKQDDWVRLQPYLDTCLLPITGLSGLETPWEITKSLEQLRDLMDLVEIPFKGRTVTFPAVQYLLPPAKLVRQINHLSGEIKKMGMSYVILITIKPEISLLQFLEADLIIGPSLSDETLLQHKTTMADQIVKMWKK